MSGADKSDKKQDSSDGQAALDAYLRLLESKGADSEVLALRRRVLSRLNLIMRGQARTTTIYRFVRLGFRAQPKIRAGSAEITATGHPKSARAPQLGLREQPK